MSDNNIKIVRLQSGQDIIADIQQFETDNVLRLLNPMTLHFKRTEVGNVMMVSPWLPVELIEENVSNISMEDVLTIVNPKQKIIDYYYNMVNIQLVSWLEKHKDMLDVLDHEVPTEEYESDEEEDQEELQYLKENNLLH